MAMIEINIHIPIDGVNNISEQYFYTNPITCSSKGWRKDLSI